MLVIVCYDVSTETREGRRRLRRVARVCEGTGQRVQKSVFECQVDRMQLEELERRLLAEIRVDEDCLRLYRLAETRGCEVREYGRFRALDYDAPLLV
ncbi:MAG: CRISPR-associated endonuclease Cas2 [Candidatus Accumulibacter sp.]|uniref:CRISPR-associated endonuclease Cas2 n=1 Tax=Accumulibacter sp. TaxID=2053492 RepID=UPI0019F81908|nr:CRISPR-associated endonuclease Cas2 [Accumulibacter sp.]MBE2258930.1 CRISPR-associated endonuclease Cas2 [Paracoccaceae bacterium]MCB1943993.1 CRISPR-associated endonuclease Cas2 [Accumulibacter sp.]MCP5249062.1 CRISPR-associated endonuclease Cas2 [Accumulibacter sp.]